MQLDKMEVGGVKKFFRITNINSPDKYGYGSTLSGVKDKQDIFDYMEEQKKDGKWVGKIGIGINGVQKDKNGIFYCTLGEGTVVTCLPDWKE